MDLLKTLHVGCALLSIGGFLLRGMWMLHGSALLKARVTRILPHVIDTLLLVSAIALAWRAQLAPWEHAWLGAKLIALVVYILLGSIALKYGKTRRVRLFGFVLALATFAYIVLVAVTRSPLPGL